MPSTCQRNPKKGILAVAKQTYSAEKLLQLPQGQTSRAKLRTCSSRHGKTLAPGLEAKLKAAYPNDAARGFEAGDFRGVFWAEVKPQKP